MADVLAQARRHRARILERAELRVAGESRGRETDHGHASEDHEDDAEAEIDPLVAHEAPRDALIDDVALLKEELPGRYRRADDGDDEQHGLAELALRQV